MTIGEEAKALYEEHEGEQGFCAALMRSFLYGVVVKGPEFVLLAEEVFTDGKRILAIGPECEKNCWWVYYAAAPRGTASSGDFMAAAPYSLPYVGFKRRGKTKVYSWDKIRKEIHGRRTVSPSTCTTEHTAGV